MRQVFLLVIFLLVAEISAAQQDFHIDLNHLPQPHPRVMTTAAEKEQTLTLLKKELWAKNLFEGLRQRTDKYIVHGPEWLSSRLCMYWKSHATDVFIKGEYYDHAGGEKAPEPTVMFNGARSHATNYGRPSIEELKPYDEDERGLYLPNNSLEGHPSEYVSISKTGCQVAAINMDILNVARDAAFIYWITGNSRYAEVAAQTFDTYMAGIYYRHIPVDLNHGHQQTLVGMTTFEVIHEDALSALVPLYDFLYDYLKTSKSDRMEMYAAAFKKWADNIIDNGVPHNNWDLIQAHYIMNIALVLEDNNQYKDGKGRQYYINNVLNANSIRQWGLKKLADYGFDSNTGIWAECPGYSLGVVNDYVDFVSLFGKALGIDMLPQFPILEKAVTATSQYLFPNRMTIGFGDTHPSFLRSEMIVRLIQNAQQFKKLDQERRFTAMLRLFAPDVWNRLPDKGHSKKEHVSQAVQDMPLHISSFFVDKPIELDKKIPAAFIGDFVSPLFYAPNVSWLVQRNGMEKDHSLMISENASLGNHMHANGISMEFYGKGFPLAPDAGIGLSLYSGQDYLEYYGQYPSHNTVCVDGVSSYPIMMSNHAFKVLSSYPQSGLKTGIYGDVSYSNVYFREPETQADQTRLLSIITTSPVSGYYVDIFRSKRSDGKDKMHDYFYHNLGQTMTLEAADGSALSLNPTQELAFAGGHLYGYSYLYDKKQAVTDKNIKASFVIKMSDGNDITMKMWQRGDENREVYSALGPMCEGLSRVSDMPYSVKDQPMLTYVARQKGEAWTHPFVSILEPSTRKEPGSIASVSYFNSQNNLRDFVGVCVKGVSGRTDYIFSQTASSDKADYQDMSVTGDYAVISETNENNSVLFLGKGTSIRKGTVSLTSNEDAHLVLEKKDGIWYINCSQSCIVKIGTSQFHVDATPYRLLSLDKR